MNTTAPSVAVLLLNWNGWADTIECLESVLRLDYPNFHVILCDNGSTDGSVGMIREWAAGRLDAMPGNENLAEFVSPPVKKPVAMAETDSGQAGKGGLKQAEGCRITLIKNDRNSGFAGGNNIGLRHALARQFDYVWLLNTDTAVRPDALALLVDRMENDPQLGLCGSMLLYYDAPEIIEEAGGCRYFPFLGIATRLLKEQPAGISADWKALEARLGYVSAASCLVSRRFLEQIGLMSEDYFLYGEELDWALRAKGKFKQGFEHASIVYHKKGRSTGSKSRAVARSPASSYYLWRARRRIVSKFHSYGLPGLFAVGFASACFNAATGGAQAARAIVAGLLDRDFRAERH